MESVVIGRTEEPPLREPMLTARTFSFDESVRALKIAAAAPPADLKMQIVLPQ